jgi:hypothetical protein
MVGFRDDHAVSYENRANERAVARFPLPFSRKVNAPPHEYNGTITHGQSTSSHTHTING